MATPSRTCSRGTSTPLIPTIPYVSSREKPKTKMTHKTLQAILLVATPILLSFQTSCGAIFMCPATPEWKIKLDKAFFKKASECENGDDEACKTISQDAMDKQETCKNCRGCSGEEKYEEVAEMAKEKNGCEYHKNGDACFALATREGLKAEQRNQYSSEEVALYKKACEYGSPLACKMAKSRGDEMTEGIMKNAEKMECTNACKSNYPSCMNTCGKTSACQNKCIRQVRVCMSTCN